MIRFKRNISIYINEESKANVVPILDTALQYFDSVYIEENSRLKIEFENDTDKKTISQDKLILSFYKLTRIEMDIIDEILVTLLETSDNVDISIDEKTTEVNIRNKHEVLSYLYQNFLN